MVYLADWRHVLKHRKQISSIQWHFDTYGPFVWDVHEAIKDNPAFTTGESAAGSRVLRRTVKLRDLSIKPTVDDDTRTTLDHVVESTASLSWIEFVRLIYSTYPIVKSARFTDLNLVALGAAYQS